ncbi:hypothetical protein BCR44DRAFT_310027 [Catenaria anguillulae PL171]|uniref:Uncharacterized protein n=1 Tax=Catenaria anguillulae PL171 TaxID=765915 RepID=A0A1Y2HUJ4_9FUNG|nr:hypothetical protein BCR44DRAFT_310027 [Catenaria anguillulae PL171]
MQEPPSALPDNEDGVRPASETAQRVDNDTSEPEPEGPDPALLPTDPTPVPQTLAFAIPQTTQVEAEITSDPQPEPEPEPHPALEKDTPPPPQPSHISPPQVPQVQPPPTPPRSPVFAPPPIPIHPLPPPIQPYQQQPSSPAGSISSTSSTSTRARKSRRPPANTFVQERDWNYSSKPGPELRIPEFESKLSLIDDRVVDEPASPPKKAAVKTVVASGRDKDRDRGRSRIRREYELQHDDDEPDQVAQPQSPTIPAPLVIQPRAASSFSSSPHRERASPSHQQLPPLPATAPSPTQSQPFIPKSILKKRVSFSADSPKGHEKVAPMDPIAPPQRDGPTLLTDRIPEEDVDGGRYYQPGQQPFPPPFPSASPPSGQYYSAPPLAPSPTPGAGGYYLPPPTGYWPPAAPQSSPSYMSMPPAPYWPPPQPLPSALGFAASAHNPPSPVYHVGNGGGAGPPSMVFVPASSMYAPGGPSATQGYASLPPIVPMSAPAGPYGGYFESEYVDAQDDNVAYPPAPTRHVPVPAPARSPSRSPPHPPVTASSVAMLPQSGALGSYDPLAKSSYMWHHAHRQQLASHQVVDAAVAAAMSGQQRKASAAGRTGRSSSRSSGERYGR